ncbi:unnamed protein product [Commensalibacter communis]|uniref:hypothetical protein n=1 Tax=Commensalibacter communis TaxID=2972786 RepID=UPI0022FFA3B8|nr:hypothetical protein [Commensalibacter communis]CAI3938222.1 unnamed protein product [Commensalibacter communis]
MNLVFKKILLCFGACVGLLIASTSISFLYAQQPSREEIAKKMAAFEKLTKIEQQKEFANIKKIIVARADQEIKQASTPKWKKILEENKQENLARIDAMAKMTPKELHAYHEKMLTEFDASMKKQRTPLTPEELTPEKKADIIARAKAALEKAKATQGQE